MTFIKSVVRGSLFQRNLAAASCMCVMLLSVPMASAQGTTYQDIQNFRIAMTDSAYSAAPGTVLTYNISVTNATTVAMSNVSVSDTLPRELIANSASDNAEINGQIVHWSGLTFLPNEMKLLTLRATVQLSVRNAAVIVNTAKIDGGAMAQDTTIAQTGQSQGITLAATHTPEQAAPGGTVMYTVILTNSEKVTKNVAVRANFSREFSIVSATDQGHGKGNQMYWSNLILEGEKTRQISITLKASSNVTQGGKLSFVASIPGSEVEDPVVVAAGVAEPVAAAADPSFDSFPIDTNAYVNTQQSENFIPGASVPEPAPTILAPVQAEMQIMPQTGIEDFTAALENTQAFLRPFAGNTAGASTAGLSWLMSIPGLLIGGRLARRRR